MLIWGLLLASTEVSTKSVMMLRLQLGSETLDSTELPEIER